MHPKNKLHLYQRYALSKISWHLTVANISKTLVCEHLDNMVSKYIRQLLELPVSTVREQPPRMCKNISSNINCESAIGQHLITNPECAKTYTGDNFRIIGQARSSFHLGVLESVYIKTQIPVLCRQKEFVFSLKLFN